METLAEYFDRPDTPAKGSPIGNLIPRVLEKYPELNFEQARAKAHDLLANAAKRWAYRTPPVYSASELDANRERLKTAFGKSSTVSEAA